jgi:hypothetical protein
MPMPRQPEVFVHELEPEQTQRLVRIARTSKDRVRLRRAGIVLASVQGRPVSVIAQMLPSARAACGYTGLVRAENRVTAADQRLHGWPT